MAMRLTYLLTFIVISMCLSPLAQAQEVAIDSAETRVHSPKKAALMSALAPGLGQVYNEKYWKVPIVYAGLGTAVYFFFDNRWFYLKYREAYLNDLKAGEDGFEPSWYSRQGIGLDQLRSAADERRRLMEFSILGFVAMYGLQIIDATVDAHLFSFDVGDELTLQWTPLCLPTGNQKMMSGIGLNLSF